MKSEWLSRFLIVLWALFPFLAEAATAASAGVQIREWDVPTPSSWPHDPAVAPDGSLWYTGMRANILGRLDPKTGQIKEFVLKTPDSGPHGLAADREGKIWFTANYKNYIGKLDPATDKVMEYPIPDPVAGGPHTPVCDRTGILWFTVQEGNYVGRSDPRTGKITVKKSPTHNSAPYGIAVNSKGIPFFSEFGTNKIASLNPTTMEIAEYALPESSRPRRLAIAPDDKVYYADFARGYLGRLDPATKETREWPSPGGPGSRPYGIAITPDGRAWYSESGTNPDTIVGFDPKTEAFAAWPIPSGGGVVRHMVSTPGGDLYIASSGVNKVGIVKIER